MGWVCQEYLAICEEYGVEVTDEDLKNVLAIADEDGEVRMAFYKIYNMIVLKT